MASLSQIVGQERAIAALSRAIAAGRLASAYLFEGMVGIGKATAARALAQTLECERAGVDACCECDACRKVDAGLHPDVVVVEPDGQQIKIAQIRQLTARAAFRPH